MLAFRDPELERAFEAVRVEKGVRQGRFAILAGAPGFVLLWAIVDDPEAKRLAALLVLAVGAWIALVWSPLATRAYDAVALLPYVPFTGLIAAVLLALPPASAPLIALITWMLTSMFLFAFIRARFPLALAAGVAHLAVMVPVGVVLWDRFGEGRAPAGIVAGVGGRGGGFVLILLFGGFLLGLTASVAYRFERADRVDFARRRELDAAHDRSESLLRSILPGAIVDRLAAGATRIADDCPAVSVVFADISGFSPMAANLAPGEVVAVLDRVFTVFDDLSDRHGLEKIKTIGDAYMAVAGAPEPVSDHAAAAAELALDMVDAAAGIQRPDGSPVDVRIGISSGPAVAGVIGTAKFSYDLWGDTVNVASRMESHGLPGRIQVSAATRDLLAGRYPFEERGEVAVKGMGTVRTWFLTGRQ